MGQETVFLNYSPATRWVFESNPSMTQQIDCADWIFIIHAVMQPRSEQPAITLQIRHLSPLPATEPFL